MLLSIVVPAYNAEKFLSTLLLNLIDQCKKLKGLVEILIINDGSTDRTTEIVGDFCLQYPIIRLVSQENKGESGARNTGIENAHGEYIYFLDSDDSLHPGSISFFVEKIQENLGTDLICFAYTSTISGQVKDRYNCAKYANKCFQRNTFVEFFLKKHIPIHVCSNIIRRDFINKNSLRFHLGLKIGADIEWLLTVCSKIDTAVFFNRPCYIYQIRDDSVMQGYKTYSMLQYHSFEIRRDIIFNSFYQQNVIKHCSNFWIENQLLSNLVYYLKSKVKDKEITSLLVKDCELFKLPVSNGNKKNLVAIYVAKILPMKFILKLLK